MPQLKIIVAFLWPLPRLSHIEHCGFKELASTTPKIAHVGSVLPNRAWLLSLLPSSTTVTNPQLSPLKRKYGGDKTVFAGLSWKAKGQEGIIE